MGNIVVAKPWENGRQQQDTAVLQRRSLYIVHGKFSNGTTPTASILVVLEGFAVGTTDSTPFLL